MVLMAHLNGTTVVDLVRRSELIGPEELEQAVAECRRAHGGSLPENADGVLRFLRDSGLLTGWQCEQLAAGKVKGFFLTKYKILDHIGSGGMSSVYLAEHQLMRQRRAIKVLPRRLVEESTYLDRFYREAEAIAKLDHSNIVRAYDVDHDGDLHYLVMEYVPGENLQALIERDGPLGFREAGIYTLAACDALDYAHRAGVVHRDVKPSNLLLDESGIVKLLDLGLARFSDESSDASVTQADYGAVLGTADYLAPEQALDSHAAGPPADLYGLGCTLYFLLTGHPPFTEGSVTQRILNHQTKMPPEIYRDRPDCPSELVDICWKMIQKNPQDRYPSVEIAGQVLRGWLRSVPATDKTAVPAATSLSRRRLGPPPQPAAEALADAAENPSVVTARFGSGRETESSSASAVAHVGQGGDGDASSVWVQRRQRLQPGRRLRGISWIAAGIAAVLVVVLILLAMSMKLSPSDGSEHVAPGVKARPATKWHEAREP